MKKMALIFFGTFILTSLVSIKTNGAWIPVFTRLFESYFALLTVFGATSIAFSNYIDAVIRDIPEEIKEKNLEKYELTIDSFIDLKNEIISNVLLFVGLIIINYILLGIIDLNINISIINVEINWLFSSIQLSLFSISIYALYNQVNGFRTANEYKRLVFKKKEL